MPKILEKVKNFFSGKFIYKPKRGLLFDNWLVLTLQGVGILPAILGVIVALLLAKACVECCKK